MSYTDGTEVRYYISAGGTSTFGTDIISTAVMTTKISDADSIIDMELSKRYNTPPAISTISKIMSAWFALRSVYSNEIPSALAFTEEDYKKAMQWLHDLREEIIDLPSGTSTSGNTITEKGSTSKYWSARQDYIPIFDVDDELQWRVDTTLLEKLEDDKQ